MKTKQEISWNLDDLSNRRAFHGDTVRNLQHFPTAYIGNKKKLLGFLEHVIMKHELKPNLVCDAFSGSSVVSLFFKKTGKRVISNDILSFSFYHSLALVENEETVAAADEELD